MLYTPPLDRLVDVSLDVSLDELHECIPAQLDVSMRRASDRGNQVKNDQREGRRERQSS